MNRIKIRISFWIVLVFMGFTGYGILYSQAVLFAFLHELCHIGTAKKFGLEIGRFYVTPIGCNAVIKNFYSISCVKRCAVLAAGPVFNMIVGVVAYFTGYQSIMYTNAALFICNIIPCVPFDGGRIFKNLFGEMWGVLSAEKICSYVGRFFAILIIAAGILQFVFYNLNVSILCLGIYVMKESRKDYVSSVYAFYKAIMAKKQKKDILKTKEFILYDDTRLRECLKYITLDKVLIVNIAENGGIKERLTEWQVLERLKCKGQQ